MLHAQVQERGSKGNNGLQRHVNGRRTNHTFLPSFVASPLACALAATNFETTYCCLVFTFTTLIQP